MTNLDVTNSGQRLLNMAPLADRSACLQYVSRALRNGAPPLNYTGLDTAYQSWQNNAENKHPSDTNVPAGYPAFFGPDTNNTAGDVIISLGNGLFACTDYPTWNQVGTATLAQRSAQIGRNYLGWAGTFLGYTLTTTTLAETISTPITPPEETIMLRFITADSTTPWYATNGLTKRVLAVGENQLLVDLGLAVYEINGGGVKQIGQPALDRIPVVV